MREVIIRNAVQCKLCHQVIESKHVHDFRSCKCGEIFVDGGREYLRRGGGLDNVVECSEVRSEPAVDWLTERFCKVVEDSTDSKEVAVRQVLEDAFKWTLPRDIMNALDKLPIIRALNWPERRQIEATIRKELIGEEK